jgi:putative PEP-CTERM system TPR-repeat lipoprotein
MERARREIQAGEWQNAAFDLHAVVLKQPKNAEAWLLLARLSLDAADANGAQSALAHARTAGAKGSQVDALQARIWLAGGHAPALLKALDHHTIDLPQPERTVLQAHALLLTGQPAQAIALLQPLVARQPGLTEAQVLFAECLAQEGQLAQALGQLAAAERLDPKSPEPLLLAGRIDEWLGRYPAAEQAIAEALKRMPPSEPLAHRVTALVALTESRLAQGRIPAAAHSQAILAKLEPLAPETLLLDARIKLAHRDLVGGTDELERVVADAPNFVEARLMLGAALLQRGQTAEAQQQLQQVVSATPDNLQARKLLADAQLKLGEPGAALSVLTPALGAPHLDPQLLSLFNEAAQRSGNSQALLEALQRSQREHPEDEAVAVNLAAAYLSTGHAAQALALLQKTADRGDLRRDKLLITAVQATRGPEAAGREVDALLAVHPHVPGMLDLAASYWASQNQLDRARALLRQALAANPNDQLSLIDLAHVEEAAGDPAAAQRRLSAALSIHPDSLAVRLALAQALVQNHALEQARHVLQGAQDAQNSPDVQFGLAQVALAQGDLAAANAAFDRAIASQPGQTVLLGDAGVLLMRANQYAAALNRFTQATAAQPNNAMYWLDSARAQLALNEPGAARASLEKADHLQPDWLPVVSTLALIDLRQGNGSAALSRVGALLAHNPKDPGALALKGDLELALHQPAAAITAYGEAQRLRPSADVAVKLYHALLVDHAAHPAQPLQQWLKRVPTDWRVRGVLGNYYLLVAHSPQKAVPQFRAVLKQVPNDAVALNNLAWTLSRTGDPEAVTLAERAYRLAPASAGVNDTLGWILAGKGQSVQALPYLERAVKLAPQDPELGYHYAYVLAKTGRQAQARQILSKILASPQPFDARRKAQQLLATLGA